MTPSTRQDVGFAYKVFRTFLQRVDERVETVNATAGRAVGFHHRRADGDRPRRGPLSPHARRGRRSLAAANQVRHADVEVGRQEGGEERGARRPATSCSAATTASPGECTRPTAEELLEIYLNAFTMSFDPHTDYMSPRQLHELQDADEPGIGGHRGFADGRGRLHHDQADRPRRPGGQGRPAEDQTTRSSASARAKRGKSSTLSI